MTCNRSLNGTTQFAHSLRCQWSKFLKQNFVISCLLMSKAFVSTRNILQKKYFLSQFFFVLISSSRATYSLVYTWICLQCIQIHVKPKTSSNQWKQFCEIFLPFWMHKNHYKFADVFKFLSLLTASQCDEFSTLLPFHPTRLCSFCSWKK